jgi:hypothetical protein
MIDANKDLALSTAESFDGLKDAPTAFCPNVWVFCSDIVFSFNWLLFIPS